MTRKRRPSRRFGVWLTWCGVLLMAASLLQLLFGVPLSDGIAPAGLSLGPIAIIGGIVMAHSRRPLPGERHTDDGIALRLLDNLG